MTLLKEILQISENTQSKAELAHDYAKSVLPEWKKEGDIRHFKDFFEESIGDQLTGLDDLMSHLEHNYMKGSKSGAIHDLEGYISNLID